MLTWLYVLFIVLISAYLVFSERKEVPLFVVLHAILQYGFTLALWLFQMTSLLGGLLLGFISASTFLLIWARSLNYSRELYSIKLFFSLTQWIVVLAIGVFMAIESPYYRMVPASSWQAYIDMDVLSIHPVIKLCGNLLLFTTFFHIMGHWGQKWNIRKSLFDLMPVWLYFLLLSLLKIFQFSAEPLPII
ncbi:MAG: hypothetical protein AAFR66_08415 [Bacteroidota bacterium]